ncbi:hypothetical protein [Sporosarcina sp. FSL K6-3457]|uniref:hypothetical protein n=1 Tax=Sporosarcina sp. FSL K6-3457 TaxID=2978204 RepID=UPI0030F8CBD2
MNRVANFKIEDIDGCEFIHSKSVGKAIISFERDFFGVRKNSIYVVYPDSSRTKMGIDEAQGMIDSGEWVVLRDAKLPAGYKDTKSILY